MASEDSIDDARDILLDFAERTGLTNREHAPRRYLWTDAHAVCTFLALHRASGEDRYRRLAVGLIDQVHAVLGRHRDDDARTGWISGLDDDEGRRHPTTGGLRIGKKLNERGEQEVVDERLEWDRDGQYFHYLTKWMHALCRAAVVTGNADYARWALELARAAYAGFVVDSPRGKRLHWKMSIDLSRPLVPSSGSHDPLDGYVTFAEVSAINEAGLVEEIAGLAEMIEGRHWATGDPLGIGGLLFDAGRVVQLTATGRLQGSALAGVLLEATAESLATYRANSTLRLDARYRLAFRELGLSIGLRAVPRMAMVAHAHPDKFGADLSCRLQALSDDVPIADDIERFWRFPAHQRSRPWHDHADINAVMLATSLLPDEFLSA